MGNPGHTRQPWVSRGGRGEKKSTWPGEQQRFTTGAKKNRTKIQIVSKTGAIFKEEVCLKTESDHAARDEKKKNEVSTGGGKEERKGSTEKKPQAELFGLTAMTHKKRGKVHSIEWGKEGGGAPRF